jgi:hypothetical protein
VAAIVPLQYHQYVSTMFLQYKPWMSLNFKFKPLFFISKSSQVSIL